MSGIQDDYNLLVSGAQSLRFKTGRSDHTHQECMIEGRILMARQDAEYAKFKAELDSPSPSG